MSKSKKPAPASPDDNPKSLDQQAKECYAHIESNELVTAANYWDLGEVFNKMREQQGWNFPALLKHAVETLKMNKTRVTRALRTRKQHPARKDVTGLSLYEALAHNKAKEASTPQPVGSRLTTGEFRAAARFEKAVGSKERAVEVLVRIVKNGEKPVKTSGNERLNALVKLATPKRRSEFRKNPQQFVKSLLSDLAANLDDIRLSAAGKAAKRALGSLMEDCGSIARRYLTVGQAENLGKDPVRFCADFEQRLNEALGLPVEQTAASLPAPSVN